MDALYGCLWANGRELLLDASSDDFYGSDHYGEPILGGRYVAWVYTTEDISCKADCPPNYDATTEYVNVYDLKKARGKVTTADPAFDSLRLNSSGDAAWLTLAGGGNLAVNAWKGAQSRVLDTGPITRFRLRGPKLSWVNGDVQHAVTLR